MEEIPFIFGEIATQKNYTDRELKTANLVQNFTSLSIHQNEYKRLHQSHKKRITLFASERYQRFKQQFPDILKRANLG